MASVIKEVRIDAAPTDVWSALRDWTALHTRLVPGFVVDTKADGADRLVTFFNGSTVREILISSDDERRRLVWSVVDGPYSHYNASAQALPDGTGTRFVWTSDFRPDELAERTDALMERGIQTVKQTLES